MSLSAITQKDIEDPILRKYVAQQSFFHFCAIYFPEMFTFPVAQFHKQWYKLLKYEHPMTGDPFTFLVLIGFRESAKTSIAKLYVLWMIVTGQRRFISYVSYDSESAEDALFDVSTWLQTNKLLIRDFGQLYYDSTAKHDGPQKRSVKNFKTSNGVRVKASTIRKTMRGKISGFDRPDMYVFDDFENSITKKSSAITRQVIEYFKEVIPGMAADARCIFVCNRISDTGSVAWLEDTAQGNPDWVVSEVKAIEEGKVTWEGKFVLTDEEARIVNEQITNPKLKVRSLETLKRTMNKDGRPHFEQEMLNQPVVQGDRFFDIEKIDARIAVLQARQWQSEDPTQPNYMDRQGDWKIWGYYNDDLPEREQHLYVVSADIAEGGGNDSSVIQVLDITKGRQVQEYESAHITPDMLGYLMVDSGKNFGHCVLVPERNSMGHTTVTILKQQDYPVIYREVTVDKITEKKTHKFGWHTNSKTKPIMLFEFKRDFEAGLIEINSLPLLREMRAFTNNDVPFKNADPDASNHFDRVIAFAIAWHARNYPQIRGFK